MLQYDLQQVKTNLAKVKRLINIVRPADLPPLKHPEISEPGAKKKFELPLFGKKRTFGLGNPKATATSVNKQSNKNTKKTDLTETPDFVEEFDDEDEDAEQSNTEKSQKEIVECEKAQNNEQSTSERIVDKKQDKQPTADADETETVDSTISASQTEQPTSFSSKSIVSEKIAEHQTNNTIAQEQKPTEQVRSSDKETDKSTNQITHKSRQRNRQRGQKRAHVDVDEAEEEHSPNKFSDWMPPENQSGDGITDLNSKFGY